MSIIILKHGELGYTASLRFDDPTKDVDISADSHESIYKQIERIVKDSGGK